MEGSLMFESLDAQDLRFIAHATLVTLQICGLAVLLGGTLGLILGILATGRVRVLRWLSTVWVSAIRGVPVLLIIFFVYFGVPLLSPGSSVPEYWAAVIALSVFASAYISEIVRGSIQAIPRGQFEAAEALGLPYLQLLRWVILPQATRIIIPPGIGFLVILIKDSSLVAVIGLIELTRSGNIVASQTGQPITSYLVVGAVYFVICYTLSLAGRRYERRLTVRASTPNVIDALPLAKGATP
ncbi:amino acid ABC transporter permease [Rhodococcus rhodochrous]|nr:amino acid ABC transporter permease [Rhodococcus rhodochrous]